MQIFDWQFSAIMGTYWSNIIKEIKGDVKNQP